MESKVINLMGMKILEVKNKTCIAHFAYNKNDKWITLYDIKIENKGKGEAQELLKQVIEDFEGYTIGGTVALNPIMKHIYNKLNILEYKL